MAIKLIYCHFCCIFVCESLGTMEKENVFDYLQNEYKKLHEKLKEGKKWDEIIDELKEDRNRWENNTKNT